MKALIITFVTLIPIFTFSQKAVTTPYFTFPCDCIEVEKTTKNGSTSYSYQSADGNFMYMITFKNGPFVDKAGFLDAIKNSGTFKYVDITFKGKKAILADFTSNGDYLKHIGFFYKDVAYTIILGSHSKNNTNKLYNNFENQFKIF